MSDQLQVRFSVRTYSEEPEIKGEVTRDSAKREKIVFISGYKANWRTWRGQLPKDGEEWVCEVLKDTMPDKSHKGALLVRLVRKAEQKLWWDCCPNTEVIELFGTRLPKVTCVTRIGVRDERTDDFRVSCVEDIKADWPENIRTQATEMLSSYLAAKDRFVAMVTWPTLPQSDPDTHDYEVEVSGYKCRIHTYVGVGVNGLERYWSFAGPVYVQGSTQLLSDQLKAKPGEGFTITTYSELCTLCALFGKSAVSEVAFGDSQYYGNKGKVSWGKLQLSLNPKALFDGSYTIDVINVDQYGQVTCNVTLHDLGFTVEVKGFKVEPEKQKAVYFCTYAGPARWRPYGNIGFSDHVTKAMPVVQPAHVSWATKLFLSEDQQRQLITDAAKWSLIDHTHFFRSALLTGEAEVISRARKDSEYLAKVVGCKDFSITVLSYTTATFEYESNDGMGTRLGGGDTYYYPAIIGSFGSAQLSEKSFDRRDEASQWMTANTDLDKAIRWYVTKMADQLREQLQNLRQAFTAQAQYEESPAYTEPSTTVTTDERQDIDRKIEELLAPMQSILDQAAALLAREDFTVRQAKEVLIEKQRCEEIRATARGLCALPHFVHLDRKIQDEMRKVAQDPADNTRSLFSYTAQDFSTMSAEELRKWQEWANGVLGGFRQVELPAQELQSKIERGDLLFNFGGHFRVMGSTGQAQYWVIRPDGNQRDANEVSYRKRYSSEGEKHWTIVEADELAISWFKGNTSSPHEFRVDKFPVNGCTREQLETVARLEQEIEGNWDGRTGISGRECPEIGLGWNLKPTPKMPDVIETPEQSEPADLSAVTTLLGVAVERRKK